MTSRALAPAALALVFAHPAAARAQECREFPVNVQILCRAGLGGTSGASKTFEAASPKTRLSMAAVGKSAVITMGDYTLSAALACSSSQSDKTMAYTFEVKLQQKGRPYASPLHLAMLRNLGLDDRAGKSPLRLDSYFFFEPAPLTLAGTPFTRLDYGCWIDVSR